MNGALTRKRLQEAGNYTWRKVEKEYEPLHGTPAEKLNENCGAPEGVPGFAHNIPHMPNAHALGTPMEAERIKAARRERQYDRWWRIGGMVVLLGVFAVIGLNVNRQRQDPISTDVTYHQKAQRLVAGRMSCELNPYEGCLVCMHKDVLGQPSVSTHC